MRCGRCGNENADTNRFCGMCGATLTPPAQSSPGAKAPASSANPPLSDSSSQRVAVPGATPREQTLQSASSTSASQRARTPAAPASSESMRASAQGSYDDSDSGISGPSFLGLSQPANSSGRSDKGRRDDFGSSRNVDYLLEDDDEPKSGWGKFVLILLALALAGGFGYLHWKQGGFDWLLAGIKKPASAQSDSQQTSGDTAATQPAAPPAENTAPAGSAPAAPTGSAASPAAPTDSAPNAGAQPPSTAATSPDASAPAQSTPTPDSSSASSSPPQNAASAPQTNSSGALQPPQPGSDNSSSDDSDNTARDQPAKAAPAAPLRRAPPKPSPSRPIDSVAEAQRYIYGRGVPRDCDRGVHMLKSTAAESSVPAMISLGTLYSTGTCAPRDLPTAYRWFAVALHKQPDNQALQNDLQSLWSQMTQPERQLAIKLSQ